VPTSIHIPPRLLAAVDRRARVLKISRNRLIIRALEKEIAEGSEWSAGFFDALRATPREDARAFSESMDEVQRRRTGKAPPSL
jgi:hypothetical protein